MADVRDVNVPAVEEVGATSSVLMAAAFHLARTCKQPNDAYMTCRRDKKDPSKCLDEGAAVTQCSIDFFKHVNASCAESFTKHWRCLDKNNQEYKYCRSTEKEFNACALDKLGLHF